MVSDSERSTDWVWCQVPARKYSTVTRRQWLFHELSLVGWKRNLEEGIPVHQLGRPAGVRHVERGPGDLRLGRVAPPLRARDLQNKVWLTVEVRPEAHAGRNGIARHRDGSRQAHPDLDPGAERRQPLEPIADTERLERDAFGWSVVLGAARACGQPVVPANEPDFQIPLGDSMIDRLREGGQVEGELGELVDRARDVERPAPPVPAQKLTGRDGREEPAELTSVGRHSCPPGRRSAYFRRS